MRAVVHGFRPPWASMRLLLWLLLLAAFPAPAAEGFRVLVTVKPVHSVVAGLMAGVEEWAASIGGTTCSLWVVDGNDGAARFYRSLGYVPTLDRQRISKPPVRWETRYEKRLTAG